MRHAYVAGVALIAGLLTSTAAWSQETSDNIRDRDEVLVEGRRIEPAVAKRYVGGVSTSLQGQMARFQTPVCPVVSGFEPRYNAIVERRLRKVAAEAGAQVDEEGCSPNLLVVLTEDADSVMPLLKKYASVLFEGVEADVRRDALRPGPVHSWFGSVVLNETGQMLLRSPTGLKIEPSDNAGPYLDKLREAIRIHSVSIIKPNTQYVMNGSVVVIDRDAAMGKTLTQIADYAAMRTLAAARAPDDLLQVDTIMTLFNEGARSPASLTLVDRAYLRGLYRSPDRATANTVKASIMREISELNDTN